MAEVQELTFFPEIDDDQTVKNVKAFFVHKIPRFQRMSGLMLRDDLRSPVIDGMPKSHSSSNGTEQSMLRTLELMDKFSDGYLVNAGRIIVATVEAIKKCDADYQYILIGSYSLHQSTTHMIKHMGYAESQFHIKKRNAHLQFADYFERTRKECNAGFYSLIAFENRSSTGV